MSDTSEKMHSTDMELIKAAAGDPSVKVIEMTTELLDSIGKALDAREAYINEHFPRL